VDDNSAKSIGKLLGAGAIVTGAFANLGDVYSLTLKAINIETATVAVSYPADIAKSARIETMLASGGGAASGGGSAGTQTAQKGNTGGSATAAATPAPVSASASALPVEAEQKVYKMGDTGLGGGMVFYAASKVQMPPVAPPAKAPGEYRIGDTGPGGGTVFYDQGSNANGWRYLEAAPVETEAAAQWGADGSNVGGTGIAVGAGKQNTALIIRALKAYEETGRAAQICDALSYGGYDDWFLPSKDELALMYTVLAEKGLDVFRGDWYKSSSQVDAWGAWVQTFNTGEQTNNSEGKWPNTHHPARKYHSHRVRAIRQF
jgi:hypothetical protein